jgi:hypothetical protein
MTRVVLAAAHLDSDPTNNRPKNLRALCQRCHMLHDRPHHLAQRWITYRRRSAVGDLFLGPYPAMIVALTSKRTRQGLAAVARAQETYAQAKVEARRAKDRVRQQHHRHGISRHVTVTPRDDAGGAHGGTSSV